MTVTIADGLERVLVRSGLLTEPRLRLAREEQRRTGQSLVRVLRQMCLVVDEDLSETLAGLLGARLVDLESEQIEESIAKILPVTYAREHRVLPMAAEGDRLVVAMSDPLDVETIDEVTAKTGKMIEVVVSSEAALLQAIDRECLNDSSDHELQRCVAAAAAADLGGSHQAAIRLVDELVASAARSRATDIHLEPDGGKLRVRYRTDGILHQRNSIPGVLQSVVVSRLKIIGGLDIGENRVPQSGGGRAVIDGAQVDLRISTFPTSHGENVVVRLLDHARLMAGLDHLGFPTGLRQSFQSSLTRTYGIILVTGPTGCGKTTTLYAALRNINTLEKAVFTLEDPIEYDLPLIRQYQLNVQAGMTFSVGMRAVLRQDPDVLLVGEIRDEETADTAIRASLTGHLVFSTLHTNDAVGGVARLRNLNVPDYQLASTVRGILAQRLVRRICKYCRTLTEPRTEFLQQLNMDPDTFTGRVYEGKGCDRCRGSGYWGRTGVFEWLQIDEKLSPMIIDGAPVQELRKAAIEVGMVPLLQAGIDKVLEGTTTIDEVLRAVGV